MQVEGILKHREGLSTCGIIPEVFRMFQEH